MDFIVEDVVAAMFHLGDNLTFLQKRRDKKFFSCQLNDEQIKRVRKSLVMNEAFESKLDIFSLVSKHYLVQASGSSACACCSSSYSAYACYKSRPHRPTGPLHTVASRPCPAAPARPVVALTVHVVHIAQLFLCMHLLVHMGYILLADLVRSVQRILLASPVCTRATTAASLSSSSSPCSSNASTG